MKHKWADLLYLFVLTCFVIAFFLPLFYPELKLFATPDGRLSDIFHFNYPLKDLLSKSLKQNRLPIWTNLVGMGFPPIAEAEIGAFNLLNIILFKFFSTPVAYNLGYITTFLLFAYGMFFIMRSFKVPRGISFLCAYIFTFSGFHIVQIPHYNHLQTFSYFPILFLFWKYTLDNPHSKRWLFIPLIASQMIFAGHYQYIFMSIVFLILYTYFFHKGKKKIVSLFINKITVTILFFTLGLSSMQLLPSYEYFIISQRNTILKLFSINIGGLSLPHLLQFIYPYILGDIRIGTYKIFLYRINFWETFSYIGIIPLLFAILSIASIRKNGSVRKYWYIITILLILAFEGHSPFYFLFSFAPLSWFRVHSRFIAFVSFLLVLLFGFAYEKFICLLNKKIKRKYAILFQAIVAIIIFFDIWHFASAYNASISVNSLYKPPETAAFINNFPSKRIYTLGINNEWFSYLNANGWKDIKGYIYLLNGLGPNVNMLYDIPQIQLYSGFKTNKLEYLDQYIQSNIVMDTQKNTASLSGIGINSLRLVGTNFVIAPYHISNTELSLAQTVKSNISKLNDINIYQIPSSQPMYYITQNIDYASGIRELAQKIDNDEWYKTYDAIVDTRKKITVEDASHFNKQLWVVKDTEIHKTFRSLTDQDSYFILLMNNYPGWEATIDNTSIPILNSNISSMAVYLPKGDHILTFSYLPKTIIMGAIISSISTLMYLLYVIYTQTGRIWFF
ncbi:YfhO family protein [Patescibacteria group bacterium]|nr:YfhO family protein [Patescibacteria group bacterium]MBU1472434.1 YfhO family protein [Patescibacteria group bacterium]MBU2460249.1 YfhO family protein [Patescibacteria group bacterium]MBU2544546.1 YfhO family protein [Patescibacteria group bacterium]